MTQEAMIAKMIEAYKLVLRAQGEVEPVQKRLTDTRLSKLYRLLQEARELADEITSGMVENLE